MITNHRTLDHAVRCDLCGHSIPAGSTCRVRTDTLLRRVYFEHIVCPTGFAVVIKTVPPRLLNAMAERQPLHRRHFPQHATVFA